MESLQSKKAKDETFLTEDQLEGMPEEHKQIVIKMAKKEMKDIIKRKRSDIAALKSKRLAT